MFVQFNVSCFRCQNSVFSSLLFFVRTWLPLLSDWKRCGLANKRGKRRVRSLVGCDRGPIRKREARGGWGQRQEKGAAIQMEWG